MSRVRVVAVPPGQVYQPTLWRSAKAAWPTVLDMSDVDGNIAFDFDTTAPSQSVVQALVTAHDPTPLPSPPDPLQGEIDTCKAFLGASSPTQVQIVTALKATIRLLRDTRMT